MSLVHSLLQDLSTLPSNNYRHRYPTPPTHHHPTAATKSSSSSSLWGHQFGLTPQDCAALTALPTDDDNDDYPRLAALRSGVFKAAGVVVEDDNGVGEGEGGEEGGLEEEMGSLRVIYEEEDALALEPLASSATTTMGQPSSTSAWRPTHRLTLRGGMPPAHCLRVWLPLPGYPSAASGPVFALAEGPRARAGMQVCGWVGG